MAGDRENDSPLDRAIAVLDFVVGQSKAVTVAEIAAGTTIPLPSAHRLVTSLEDRGLLQRAAGTKRFMAGRRLVNLSAKAIASAFRGSRHHAVLQAVAAEIGEQCEVGIVRRNAVVYVDSIRITAPQTLQFDPGTSAPLHCSSTGKIYLGTLAPAVLHKLVGSLRLERYTDKTVTDPEVLLETVMASRLTGWARTNEEFVAGVVGCAVPIRERGGPLVACLGVSVPAARVSFDELERFRLPLERAAGRLLDAILDDEADGAVPR